jgi:hypothetical protein
MKAAQGFLHGLLIAISYRHFVEVANAKLCILQGHLLVRNLAALFVA